MATHPFVLGRSRRDLELAERLAEEPLPVQAPLHIAPTIQPPTGQRHSRPGRELTGSERADALLQEVAPGVELGCEGVLEWPQFRRELDSALVSAATHNGDVGLVFIEIDYFKLIARHYGSLEGERLRWDLIRLCQTGRFVDGLLGLREASSCAVRVSSASYDRVRRVAGSVLTLVRTEMTFGDDCRSSVSIGCALASELESASADALIQLAEQRTREAQQAGGNRLIASGWFE